jgi:hypothetical protein
MTNARTAVAAAALAAGIAAAPLQAAAQPTYLATSFSGNSVYFLDEHMQPLWSFPVSDPLPNGVTATSSLIYAGYFADASVVAYGYDGQEHFRWSDPGLSRLSGIAAVGPYLAAASDTTVYLFQAKSGSYVAQLSADDSIEGLAYDGRYLWAIGSQLVARDFDTGFVVRSVPNAAVGCPFAGTGIANAGAGRLMLGCSDGRWFEVSSEDGSVLASGNNGLDMFDLAALPVPEPASMALMLAGLGLLGWRLRWCRLSDSNG